MGKYNNKKIKIKIIKDEKYQELISTVWVEMVKFNIVLSILIFF